MEVFEAIRQAYRLHEKWVSANDIRTGKGYNLDRIHASMLQEARFHKTGKSNASPALMSETRGELILLGKVRKALTS